METTQLPALSYILLAMLTFREMSGYELKSVIEKSIGHFYLHPSYSQIYPELRRLASLGLLVVRHVAQENRPTKLLYSVTPAGQSAVQQWLAESKVELDSYKSPFQLRLFFGPLLSEERLLGLMGDQRRRLAQSIVILEERQHDLQTRMQGEKPEKELLFPLLVVELKLATFRTELAWTDQALERLAQWYRTEAEETSTSH